MASRSGRAVDAAAARRQTVATASTHSAASVSNATSRETFRCLLLPYLLRMWHQQQMQQSLKILRGSAPPRLNFVPDKTGDRSVS
jgi:hypothetical protein